MVLSKATDVKQYLAELPDDRRGPIEAMVKLIEVFEASRKHTKR